METDTARLICVMYRLKEEQGRGFVSLCDAIHLLATELADDKWGWYESRNFYRQIIAEIVTRIDGNRAKIGLFNSAHQLASLSKWEGSQPNKDEVNILLDKVIRNLFKTISR